MSPFDNGHMNHQPLTEPTKRVGRRDFWRREHPKFQSPHFRLEKSARIINRLAGSRECELLDVGCGPATLGRLLSSNIQYHGIDIYISDPNPRYLEYDFLEAPIAFADKEFDIVVCQGVFEYVGDHQREKLAEIHSLLREDGRFLVSYTNFDHRAPHFDPSYTNICGLQDFRLDLCTQFKINRSFASSYNWYHGQPRRAVMKAIQMPINVNLPIIGRALGVEFFFDCSPR